jgi:hypothetical protein
MAMQLPMLRRQRRGMQPLTALVHDVCCHLGTICMRSSLLMATAFLAGLHTFRHSHTPHVTGVRPVFKPNHHEPRSRGHGEGVRKQQPLDEQVSVVVASRSMQSNAWCGHGVCA